MKNKKIILIIVAGIVLIAGAVYIGLPDQKDAPEVIEDTAEATEMVDLQEMPTSTSSVVESVTEEEPSAIAQDQKPNPTPRAEMVGTDPGRVNLASGDIQLVEIFAFW